MRKKTGQALRNEIITASAGVCCVCRTRGVGINIHHIDGDHANNTPDNLAVMCVRDHDAYHRRNVYHRCHYLSEGDIRQKKIEWENFIARARSNPPRVAAVLSMIGTEDYIHTIRLAMQDEIGKLCLERDFHFVDVRPADAIDAVLDETSWLNPNITLYLTNEVASIDYCTACDKGGSFTTVLSHSMAARELAPDWVEKSTMAVYINPYRPSCACTLSYNGTIAAKLSIHRCGINLSVNQEMRRIAHQPSIRSQVSRLIHGFVREWHPGKLLIGTGDPGNPAIIDHLTLPRCWETRALVRKSPQ